MIGPYRNSELIAVVSASAAGFGAYRMITRKGNYWANVGMLGLGFYLYFKAKKQLEENP